MTQNNALLTIVEAKEFLKVTEGTVRTWHRKGYLKAVRDSSPKRRLLFTRGHLEALITGICPWCNTSYKKMNMRQEFCSVGCRKKSHGLVRNKQDATIKPKALKPKQVVIATGIPLEPEPDRIQELERQVKELKEKLVMAQDLSRTHQPDTLTPELEQKALKLFLSRGDLVKPEPKPKPAKYVPKPRPAPLPKMTPKAIQDTNQDTPKFEYKSTPQIRAEKYRDKQFKDLVNPDAR